MHPTIHLTDIITSYKALLSATEYFMSDRENYVVGLPSATLARGNAVIRTELLPG